LRRDLHALATRYIDEVIKDQKTLGYTAAVPAAARKAAVADAELALRDLAASSRRTTKAVAA
jgi:hypothetical protein